MYTKENIKYYISLISKKLRIEETADFVPTYYYDYEIKLHETNGSYSFYIEVKDLWDDFKDNDYGLILHYMNTKKQIK